MYRTCKRVDRWGRCRLPRRRPSQFWYTRCLPVRNCGAQGRAAGPRRSLSARRPSHPGGRLMGWTRDRLEDVARTRLGGAKLIVVANREPYIHRYRDGVVEWIRPAGGLTTALDPVMQACG